jgi:hypothetical protein
MHHRNFHRTIPAILGAALLVGTGLMPQRAAAQPAAVQAADLNNRAQQIQTPLSPGFDNGKAPTLYEGELEDLGPQYVLLPKPKHKWFTAMFDWQTYYTNNATLAPGNKGATDVDALTAQIMAQTVTYAIGDVQAQARAGFRYQSYWYGLLSGQNYLVSGAPVKNNDFMTYTPFAEGLFQYGNFLGSVGMRYAAFTNSNVPTGTTSGTFYQEFAPYWLLGYQWVIGKSQMLLLQYDGDYRLSDTTSTPGTGVPKNLNDRTDNAFSVIYSYILGGKWAFQPTYRYQWSYYTNAASNPFGGANRNDTYNTVSLVIAYYITDWCAVRVFTNYEWRSSSVYGNNYQVANAGAGVNLNYSF